MVDVDSQLTYKASCKEFIRLYIIDCLIPGSHMHQLTKQKNKTKQNKNKMRAAYIILSLVDSKLIIIDTIPS